MTENKQTEHKRYQYKNSFLYNGIRTVSNLKYIQCIYTSI